MSLPAILEKIRESGREQVRGVEDRARAAAEDILAQAQAEARQIEAEAAERAAAPGVAERARILHRARMDSLRIVGEVKEDLLDDALAAARARLASIRADSSYPGVLRALIREALNELSSEGKENVQLDADPRDKTLIENFLNESGLNVAVHFSLAGWGGVIARSMDSKVVVINTLEARLERITPFLRGRLAALFEREQPMTMGA